MARPKPQKEQVRSTFQLDKEVFELFKEMAAAEHSTPSQLFRRWVDEYIEKNLPKYRQKKLL